MIVPLASLESQRMSIAKDFIGTVGQNVNNEPPFYVTWSFTVFVGDSVYMNRE